MEQMTQMSRIEQEVTAVRRKGGYFLLEGISIVELSGKDAQSFLQGRSSNDVKALQVGQGQLSSLLDRKGYLIAFISVHRISENKYWLLSYPQQGETILKEFSTYHFREQIEYKQLDNDFACLTLQGISSWLLLREIGASELHTEENSIQELELLGSPCVIVSRSFCGDAGLLIFVRKADAIALKNLEELALKNDFIKISTDSFETLRIEAGIPLFGVDMGTQQLLPETGFEQYAASYNKGCFQGQEVLARIKTYGAPRRALVGLSFTTGFESSNKLNSIPLDSEFFIDAEESGIIKSNVFSPTFKQFISLAYIARDYRVPDKPIEVEIGEKKYKAIVKFLPFYVAGTNKLKAKELYEKALQEFALGSEEKAITVLREVIELDPFLADAYESLGAILSRHEQYDEAIALMHRLQSLDPNSIMAHTNLSIYYMHQGDKEKAEEEKAISMGLRMSELAKEHAQKKKEVEDKQKLAEEAESRLEMFRQVLALDPSDFLANNGVGTVYVELARYDESIPYLVKAIEVKPTHTVAYLALGKAYENLNRLDDAANIYKRGIDVAAKRGDITPMKEMQLLLAQVESRIP